MPEAGRHKEYYYCLDWAGESVPTSPAAVCHAFNVPEKLCSHARSREAISALDATINVANSHTNHQLALLNQDSTQVLSLVDRTRSQLDRIDTTLSECKAQQLSSIQTAVQSDLKSGLVPVSRVLDLIQNDVSDSVDSQARLETMCVQILDEIRRARDRAPTLSDFCAAVTAKPSLHGELLAAAGTSGLQTRATNRHICSCSVRMSRMTRFSFGSLTGIWKSQSRHFPGCKYHGSPVTTEFRASILIRLLWKTLSFSFQLSTGAGGISLSPQFAITRIVDRRISPAFLLFDSIEVECARRIPVSRYKESARKTYHTSPDFTSRDYIRLYVLDWDTGALQISLENAVQDITMMLSMGYSSVQDTDSRGRTLLHVSYPSSHTVFQ